jgi:hypothetical protein
MIAPNKELISAARFRAQDMITRGYFGHTDPDGIGPNRHAVESGYALARMYGRNKDDNNIESISAGRETVGAALASLIIDAKTPSLGHRKHLLGMTSFQAEAREAGVGFLRPEMVATKSTSKPLMRSYCVIEAARTDDRGAFITGVVFDDKNNNGAYEEGEGLGGVTIGASGNSVSSLSAGGFALSALPGPIVVGCQKGDFKGQATAQVLMDTRNVHIEFISGKKEGVLNFGKPVSPASAGKKSP